MAQKFQYHPKPPVCVRISGMQISRLAFSSSRLWQADTETRTVYKHRAHVMKFSHLNAAPFTQEGNLNVVNSCFWGGKRKGKEREKKKERISYFHLGYLKSRQPLLGAERKFMHRNVCARSRWDRPIPELGWSLPQHVRAPVGTATAAGTESPS